MNLKMNKLRNFHLSDWNMNKLCVIATALFSAAPALGSDAGTTAANFLKLGIGPRAVAMGEAQVGLADDVYAAYWNPAGLAQLQTQQAGFVDTQYLQDVSEQYVAYAYPHASLGTFAGSLTYLNVGKFQGYDAAGEPTGEVGANDASFGLSYGKALLENKRMNSDLSVGVSGKYIQERLDTVSARAYAMDAGLLYHPGRSLGEFWEGWRAGLALRNLGTSLKYDTESFTLPRSFTAGVSYTGAWLGELITAAVDAQQPNDGARVFNAGVELLTFETFVLRAGYTSFGDLGNGLRFGAGVRFKTIQVDYAYAGAGELGGTHRIGITLRFAQPPANPLALAEDWYEKGMKEYKRSHYSEAMVDFNKALEIDPSQPQALEMMRKTNDQLKATVPQ